MSSVLSVTNVLRMRYICVVVTIACHCVHYKTSMLLSSVRGVLL